MIPTRRLPPGPFESGVRRRCAVFTRDKDHRNEGEYEQFVSFNTFWSYRRERAAHTRLTKKIRRHMPALHTRRVCRIRLSVTAAGASSVRLALGLRCAVSRCRSIICKIRAASPSGPCVEFAQYPCYPDNRRLGMSTSRTQAVVLITCPTPPCHRHPVPLEFILVRQSRPQTLQEIRGVSQCVSILNIVSW